MTQKNRNSTIYYHSCIQQRENKAKKNKKNQALTCKYHKVRPIELCSTAKKMFLSSLSYWLFPFRNFSIAAQCVCVDSPVQLNSVGLRSASRIWRQCRSELGTVYKSSLSAPNAYQFSSLFYSFRPEDSWQIRRIVAILDRANDAIFFSIRMEMK